MMKKWRPFWSYDIDKTEGWLTSMAKEGHQFSGLNRITRVFTFEEQPSELIHYQVDFNKNTRALAKQLQNNGWSQAWADGNWRMLKNKEKDIALYPSRDQLVKRNRLHSLILSIISIYYGVQLIFPIIFLLTILSAASGTVAVESSPFWSITALYFAQVIGVIILTITMTRKLRAFERKYYDLSLNERRPIGKAYRKWKPNWMICPDLTEKWLEEMALHGYHLVKVQATRFIFEKGQPKQTAYALDFQWGVEPTYAEIHKSAGWRFVYQTGKSFLKTSIWAKEYERHEPKPQLTYDGEEKKAQKKKVIIAHGGSSLFTLFLIGFLLWNTSNIYKYSSLGTFNYVILSLLGLAIVLWLNNVVKIIRYAFKRNVSS